MRGPDDVVIGSVTGRTDASGTLEINHLGGGQFPVGDCWAGPVTPDIMPGDTVRTTIAAPLGADGQPTGENDVDSTNVRDIFIDVDATTVDTTANTITLHGHVRSLEDAPIDLENDILELRLNASGFTWQTNNNRKDLRAQVIPSDWHRADPAGNTNPGYRSTNLDRYLPGGGNGESRRRQPRGRRRLYGQRRGDHGHKSDDLERHTCATGS